MMVMIGFIKHKVSNIIYAVLRNISVFELRSHEQHRDSYRQLELKADYKFSSTLTNNILAKSNTEFVY